MTSKDCQQWSPLVKNLYDPIKVGSIDGTDTEPHDVGIIRALNSEYRPNKGVMGDPKSTLFIGGFDRETKEADIRNLFDNICEPKRIRLVRDLISGISKQYAFVEFINKHDACYALEKLGNYVILRDKRLIVEFELERILIGWKPRRLGGGLGGKKESGQLRFGGRSRHFQKPFKFRWN